MSVRCVSLALARSVLLVALVAGAGNAIAATGSSAANSGYQALVAGNAPQAELLFTQAIESHELGPEALANAHLNRALAFQQLGKDLKAIEDYNAALNIDALSADLRSKSLYNRGLAQQHAGNAALATEDFTSSLLIDSQFAHAYLARADVLRMSGQYLFAITDYERALKYHHPETAVVYFGEALAYEALRRPADAKRLLQMAVKADANFVPAIQKLKVMGDVAEIDDATAEPRVTGATDPAPALPVEALKKTRHKAIAPPPALVNASNDTEVAPPEPADEPAVAAVAQPKPTETKVEVASVPTIPPAVTKPSVIKPVVASQPKAVAAAAQPKPLTTASITPAPQPAAAKPAPEEEVSAKLSGWVVQIGSSPSQDGAKSAWTNLLKEHKALNGKKPNFVKADLGSKGVVYRIHLGSYAERSAAQDACETLKDGDVNCFVLKSGG